jgi:hypothetical protein
MLINKKIKEASVFKHLADYLLLEISGNKEM